MTMTCGRARRLLWPDSGPREATAELVAACDHVSRCPQCRGFLDDMRQVQERIRDAIPRPEAPVEVRDRLFKALARARTEDRGRGAPLRPWRWRWAAALAVVLVAGVIWLGLHVGRDRTPSADDPLRAVAEDHLRSQGNTGLTSSDSMEVARWLAERLPFAIDVPIFPDSELKGARLLLVNRTSGAAVDYTIGGRALSYYVLPASADARAAPTRNVRLEPRAGYQIAVWDDAGLTHALVASLPGSKLVQLAHYCIEQMTAAVAA